jgi:hypothetical protein
MLGFGGIGACSDRVKDTAIVAEGESCVPEIKRDTHNPDETLSSAARH